ncbi:MAG: zinc-ribbon domain-containing protein [Eubacteriaceae bacterium]
MKNICEKCGNKLSKDDLFCGECGSKATSVNQSHNEFTEFSKDMTDNSYNKRNQRAGFGLGIVAVLMIIAILGFYIIKILK